MRRAEVYCRTGEEFEDEKKKRRDALEKIQRSTQDDPFDTVLVALSQCLPDRFLLGSFAGDADPRAASIWTGRVLLDLSKLDALWRDVVAGVGEVEHAPERGVRVGFGDLEEREVGGVGGGEGEFVDGREDTGVGDGPFEVAGGFAADDPGRGGRMAWI